MTTPEQSDIVDRDETPTIAYHATTTHRGDSIEFDEGGYYEKLRLVSDTDSSDGPVSAAPVSRVVSGMHCGFEVSETEEIAASASPEAAIFAVAHNLANDAPPIPGTENETSFHVYRIDRTPDVVISTVTGDFDLIEEVRYRNLAESPVTATHAMRVDLPERALADVQLTYIPDGTQIIPSWGRMVKRGIEQAVTGAGYPADVSEWGNISRPDAEQWEKAPRRS